MEQMNLVTEGGKPLSDELVESIKADINQALKTIVQIEEPDSGIIAE